MRAMIKCTFSVDNAILYNHDKPDDWLDFWKNTLGEKLAYKNWFASVLQNHKILIDQKEIILETVHGDDKELLRATHIFTVYDAYTGSYGIICPTSASVVEFRIRNPDSVLLKRASEKMVQDLQSVYTKRHRRFFNRRSVSQSPTRIFLDEDEPTISSFGVINVFEAQSNRQAFYGEVLPLRKFPRRLRVAFRDRKGEAILSGLTFLFACVSFYTAVMTSNQLIKGSFERLSTAFLVTAFVSFLQILLHWFDIKRQPVIKWSV